MVGNLVFRLGLGNDFGDLAFLVGFGVVALGSGYGDDSGKVRVLELAVGTFLAIHYETRLPEILEEVADFLGHGDGCFAPLGLWRWF